MICPLKYIDKCRLALHMIDECRLALFRSYAHRGIAPRVLAEIFRHVQEHPQYDTTIGVSYVEIYNDSLVDLLSTIPSEQQQVLAQSNSHSEIRNSFRPECISVSPPFQSNAASEFVVHGSPSA
eukprot:6178236-Pleurochrysis_carterae.AAC.5